jgi:hypothetical protein
MTNGLNRQARETIKFEGNGITIAEYIRHYFPAEGHWCGDECGCVDDRCIGFHHDEGEDCGCLPEWIRDLRREKARDAMLDGWRLLRAGRSALYPSGLDVLEITDLVALVESCTAAIGEHVASRRRFGHTWESIAADLGVTKQAAQQRYGS